MTCFKFVIARQYQSTEIKIHEISIIYLDHINHSDIVKISLKAFAKDLIKPCIKRHYFFDITMNIRGKILAGRFITERLIAFIALIIFYF